MIVHVRYFAYYKEQLGRAHDTIDIPEGSTVAELWQRCIGANSQLVRLWSSTVVAINRAYATRDAVLHAEDEVAFLPPVSGGDARCRITTEPLDTTVLEARVNAARHGAIVLFVGIVRETSPTGQKVQYLEYEAYAEMAEQEMESIACELEERWPECAVAMDHRIGRVAIGEASVAIAVATPHRKEAFAACEYAINRLKERVPIWKKEVFLDGSTWVGIGP